jgi:hypothetical protein
VRLETKFKPSGSPPVTTTSLRARGLDSTAHPPPAAQKVSSGFVGGHGCLVAWVCGVVLQGMQALTTWVTCLFGKKEEVLLGLHHLPNKHVIVVVSSLLLSGQGHAGIRCPAWSSVMTTPIII